MKLDSPQSAKVPVLDVEKLSVNRAGKQVLEEVCLKIDEGEFVGLVGPNGGGKTTFLLTVLGLLKYKKGRVELYGDSSPSRNTLGKIGWVSQAAANIPSNIRLTVRELVQLGTLTAGNIFWRFTAEQNERVNRAIEMAGLEEVQDTNIFHLSGGQRQRAVIARVLASKAEFILLDEPLVGIDRESRNSLLQFLDKLCHESQKTILMISHDIAAIQQASHRMIFLEERIRYDGESSCFPDLADLASLRGIQSVHETNYSEDKLYQISSIEDKK